MFENLSNADISFAFRTIPVGSFIQHVERLRENQGFCLEFQALQDWEQRRRSTMDEVARAKQQQQAGATGGTIQRKENRYANVIACKYRTIIV